MSSPAEQRLVVFGCGYVGTAVALKFAARGVRVTALTRNAASAVVLREQQIETVVADLASDEWHAAIPGGADFVLNCVSGGGGDIAAYRHNYVGGMNSIVAWARRFGAPKTLVYTGSTSVYPQGNGATVDESAAVGGAGASERAGILLAAEEALRAAGDVVGRWFILRLAGIYGPGRHHVIEQIRAGEVSGEPQTHLNLIHRDDIVAAIEGCFAAPPAVANEILNVVDDAPARKGEVVDWLAATLELPSPRFSGQPVGQRRELTPDRVISNRRLHTKLGWRPRHRTYREGFASLLAPPT